MRPATFLDLAACKGADLNLFFPVGEQPGQYHNAKQYCAKCPVITECLQYALDTGSDSGMFGGTTPADRRLIRSGVALAARFEVGHGDKAGTTAGYYREKAAGLPYCPDCLAAYNNKAKARRAKAKEGVS